MENISIKPLANKVNISFAYETEFNMAYAVWMEWESKTFSTGLFSFQEVSGGPKESIGVHIHIPLVFEVPNTWDQQKCRGLV